MMLRRVDSRACVECMWFGFASDTMWLNRGTCATLFVKRASMGLLFPSRLTYIENRDKSLVENKTNFYFFCFFEIRELVWSCQTNLAEV